MLQGVSNEHWAGEIPPWVKGFTWPFVKSDTVAPVYNPSMPMPGNGKQDQEIPEKGRGKGSHTFIIERTNLFCRRKKSWLADFILASPRHQWYWRMSTGEERGLSCWTDKPTNYKQPLLPLNPSSFIQAPFAPHHYFSWSEGNSLTPEEAPRFTTQQPSLVWVVS